MNNLEKLTKEELNNFNGGNEATDSIWYAIGYFIGAALQGDTYRHQHGRTGYF